MMNAGELLPNWAEDVVWPEKMSRPSEMFPGIGTIHMGCDWLSTEVLAAIQANDPTSYEMEDI